MRADHAAKPTQLRNLQLTGEPSIEGPQAPSGTILHRSGISRTTAPDVNRCHTAAPLRIRRNPGRRSHTHTHTHTPRALRSLQLVRLAPLDQALHDAASEPVPRCLRAAPPKRPAQVLNGRGRVESGQREGGPTHTELTREERRGQRGSDRALDESRSPRLAEPGPRSQGSSRDGRRASWKHCLQAHPTWHAQCPSLSPALPARQTHSCPASSDPSTRWMGCMRLPLKARWSNDLPLSRKSANLSNMEPSRTGRRERCARGNQEQEVGPQGRGRLPRPANLADPKPATASPPTTRRAPSATHGPPTACCPAHQPNHVLHVHGLPPTHRARRHARRLANGLRPSDARFTAVPFRCRAS